MLEENQSALVDPLDAFVQEAIDQDSEPTPAEATTTESAPVENTEEQPEVKANGVQERINKITADKHEERRKRGAEAKRADDLQKKLDELEAKKPTLTEPKREDHEYDEEAFNQASVAFQVQEQVKAQLTTQKAQQDKQSQDAKTQAALEVFNERAAALGDDDFAEKANAIPELPSGVASAIMELENGAEMVQHLYTHLDKADALANMTPMAAMMELGKLSASMSVKPEIKISAAPDPIEPVSAGSVLSSDIDTEMSIDAWKSKFY